MSDVLQKWIVCPICNNKTRLKVRIDTVLENFPLFCPKRKQETLIHVRHCTEVHAFGGKKLTDVKGTVTITPQNN